MKTYTGKFNPKNRVKYIGDSSNIIYRSSWELKYMNYCDTRSSMLRWSSEETIIPYKSPIDNKIHRYFVDFYCEYINKENKITKALIEIKPKKYLTKPKTPKKVTKKFLYESKTWAINEAKWTAAIQYCKKKGYEFIILTEETLLV